MTDIYQHPDVQRIDDWINAQFELKENYEIQVVAESHRKALEETLTFYLRRNT